MIKVILSNEILKYITEIDKNRYNVSSVKLSKTVANKLRKNSKKKSSYASNKIEGNPLSEKQVDEVIESDDRKHFLKPEQEVRNYFLALNFLEEKVNHKEAFSKELMDVLAKNGFVVPIMVNQRIRSYELSDFTKEHEKEIVKVIK